MVSILTFVCCASLLEWFVRKMFDFQLFVNIVCCTFFSWFWVRPFWRLTQNLVQRDENNVFEELSFWVMTMFVCGTSLSEHLTVGVLNQNIFDVWLKTPIVAVNSDLISQILASESIFHTFFFDDVIFPLFLKFFVVTVLNVAMSQWEDSDVLLFDSDDGMFCAKDFWFSALCELCFHPRLGFESDRFDVWFKTWCKEAETTFSEELIFEILTFCVCGTSWSQLTTSAFWIKTIFDVWLKTPGCGADSDLVSQIEF